MSCLMSIHFQALNLKIDVSQTRWFWKLGYIKKTNRLTDTNNNSYVPRYHNPVCKVIPWTKPLNSQSCRQIFGQVVPLENPSVHTYPCGELCARGLATHNWRKMKGLSLAPDEGFLILETRYGSREVCDPDVAELFGRVERRLGLSSSLHHLAAVALTYGICV